MGNTFLKSSLYEIDLIRDLQEVGRLSMEGIKDEHYLGWMIGKEEEQT